MNKDHKLMSIMVPVILMLCIGFYMIPGALGSESDSNSLITDVSYDGNSTDEASDTTSNLTDEQSDSENSDQTTDSQYGGTSSYTTGSSTGSNVGSNTGSSTGSTGSNTGSTESDDNEPTTGSPVEVTP